MNIVKGIIREHSKASEKYIDVIFEYNKYKFNCSIPLIYRRTGTEILDSDIDDYLKKVYENIDPKHWDKWKIEQANFWNSKPNADITKSFYDKLIEKFDWCCINCDFPSNPNWARRIQDLKEFGYTLSTNTKKYCIKCNKNTTQLIMIPLPRGGITGYETWSPILRNRIIELLKSFDCYEGKYGRKESLLPDHKFPEIRWNDQTKRDSLDSLSDDDILNDFQLLTNQRNQQKREVCRNCFQTKNRGIIFGIQYYYKGNQYWDKNIPEKGKQAEIGCIGCGWYDIEKWRQEIIKALNTRK